MYLTVCPLCGPGHDSSVGEQTNLTVCPPHGHAIPSEFPWRNISRDFSLADHTLATRPETAWQTMAQSPLNNTTQPVDIEEEGRSPTTDRLWRR